MDMAAMRAELERDEGVVPYAYDDADGTPITKGYTLKGYVSAGIGFMLDYKRGGRIPQPVMDFWLNWEIKERSGALAAHYPWFNTLDDVRQRACVNVSFNVGLDGFDKFARMRAALQEHDWTEAKAQLLDSDAARSLPTRYERLAFMLEMGRPWVG